MTCLHYFYYCFLKGDLPKIMGNTLIMPHYWHFWKPSRHFCKESGVPTMLVVLSLPFIIIPFIYPFFKMCHLHRKIATTNQLVKINSSSINYSRENEIILTYQGTTFSTLLIKKILHLLQSSLICKMLILYIFFFINKFFLFCFLQNKFLDFTVNISHNHTICCDLSPFLAYHLILKNYLHPSPYVDFWEVKTPP